MRPVSPFWLKKHGILGMNRRNVEVIGGWNARKHYPLVDNKLKTKLIAKENGVAVPTLLGVISHQFELRNLHAALAPSGEFVIKPAQGSGGKGILVIVARDGDTYYKSSGVRLGIVDIERHVSNILSGLYSLGGRQDVAMIEDLVHFDPQLASYSYEGVPDIRVVVYRGYPVMAMMRCATHASDGKANLHQGAVGVGLDLASGSSSFAVQNGRPVASHPDTGQLFRALRVPHWAGILHLAAQCYEMIDFGYLGVDVVIDRVKGPLILELNARPGLAIQIANREGLARHLMDIDAIAGSHHSVESRVQFVRQAFKSDSAVEN